MERSIVKHVITRIVNRAIFNPKKKKIGGKLDSSGNSQKFTNVKNRLRSFEQFFNFRLKSLLVTKCSPSYTFDVQRRAA